MKNYFKKIVSVVLTLSLIMPSTSIAFASEYTQVENQQFLSDYVNDNVFDSMQFSFSNTELSSREVDLLMEDVYSELSDEARQILEEYMSLYDTEMLSYYEEVTDTVVGTNEYLPRNIALDKENNTLNVERAAAISGMQELRNSLIGLNLPKEVFNALMAVGAEFATAATAITLSQVVVALAVVGTAVILYNNWDKISSKWSSITSAFSRSIAKSSSSINAINTGFTQKKNECTTIQQDMARGQSAFKQGTYTASADKHVEQASITKIRQGNNPTEIYYSSKNRVMLFVVEISSGYKATFYSTMGGDHVYDLVDYNVSGFKMYILVDPVKGKIFHCHLRKSVNDTEQFRKANQLDWRLKPLPVAWDTKYTNSTGSGFFQGKQID